MNDIFAKETNKTLQKKPVTAAARKRADTVAAAAAATTAAKEKSVGAAIAPPGKRKVKKISTPVNVAAADQSDLVNSSPMTSDVGGVASPVIVNDELKNPTVKEEGGEEKFALSVASVVDPLANSVISAASPTDNKCALVKSESPSSTLTIVVAPPPVLLKEEEEAVATVAAAAVDPVTTVPSVIDAASEDQHASAAVSAAPTSVPIQGTISPLPTAGPELVAGIETAADDSAALVAAKEELSPVGNVSLDASIGTADMTVTTEAGTLAAPTLPVVGGAPVSSDLTKSLRKVRLAKKAAAEAAAATTPPSTPVKMVPANENVTLGEHGAAAITSVTVSAAAVSPPASQLISASVPMITDSVCGGGVESSVGEALQPQPNNHLAIGGGGGLRLGTEVFDFTDDEDVDIPLSNIDFEALSGGAVSNPTAVATELPRLGNSSSSGPLQIAIPPPPPGSQGVGDLLTSRTTTTNANSGGNLPAGYQNHLVPPHYHHHHLHRSPIKKVFEVSPTILSHVDAMAAVEAVHSLIGGGGGPTPPPPLQLQQEQLHPTGGSVGHIMHHRPTSGLHHDAAVSENDTDTSWGGAAAAQRVKLGKRRRQRRVQESDDGDGDTEDDQLEGRHRDASSSSSALLPGGGGRPKRTKTADGSAPTLTGQHHHLAAAATSSTRPSSAASGTSEGDQQQRRGGGVEEEDGKQSPDSQKSNEDKSRWGKNFLKPNFMR
jgi:hypothetical protein